MEPNFEQKEAILTSGNALLEAGAGSGKTFVIVEHLISKINIELRKDSFSSEEIKKFLSGIVVVTFTKKAAGELQIRIQEKIETKVSENPDWEIVKENLYLMFIGTIHSFCFKLIKMGFVSGFGDELEINTSEDVENFIKDEIKNHFDQQNELSHKDIFLYKFSDRFSKSMSQIFLDATLRTKWNETKKQSLDTEIESLLGLVLKFEGFEYFLKNKISLEGVQKKGKWLDSVKEFVGILEKSKSNIEIVKNYFQYLCENKVRYTIPKNEDVQIVDYIEKIKEFRDFCKDIGEKLQIYYLEKETIEQWIEYFDKLYELIEEKYVAGKFLTFTDIEYYTLKNISDSSIEKIYNQFNYFIVDEFQDTSFFQLDILRKITKNNWSRLFFVGDVKQAIYSFRGGEVDVFNETKQNVKEVKLLKNNYRSSENIINFNNVFFEHILPIGLGYVGKDVFQIDYNKQDYPFEDKASVEKSINKLKIKLDDVESKLTVSQLEFIESMSIFQYIEKISKEHSGTICVLYRNLKPSLSLIEKLIEEDISFNAQVKIKSFDDPIFTLFYILIEYLVDKQANSNLLILFKVNKLMEISLGYKKALVKSEDIDQFTRSIDFIGLYPSFLNFICTMGLSSDDYENNLLSLKNFIINRKENIEELYFSLRREDSKSYSATIQYGENSKKLSIMTSHASKGLEFDTVILGGIYTNERSMPNTDSFGKLRGSFKFIHERKLTDTPLFTLEKRLDKLKIFSESKRLFYVSTTRAKKHLSWVDIECEEKLLQTNKNSWINGFWSFFENHSFSCNDFEVNQEKIDLNFEEKPLTIPGYFQNQGQINDNEFSRSLSIIPDLSVTKFSLLSTCPKKFYFSIVLGLEPVQNKLIESELNFDDKKAPLSSAQRGTLVHENISQAILNNEIFDEDILFDQVWIKEKLQSSSKNFVFISEEEIKFEFFGYMITGIPDLILQSKNSEEKGLEIWDFKTGARSEEKEVMYFTQLYLYAFALIQLKKLSVDEKIKLKLMYLDLEKEVVEIISVKDIDNWSQKFIRRLSDYSVQVPEYCSSCPYGNICH